MWVTVVLFALLLLAAWAGITGRGVYDSRDTAYSFGDPAGAAQRPSQR